MANDTVTFSMHDLSYIFIIPFLGNLGCFPQGKRAATRVALPVFLRACWVCFCSRHPPSFGVSVRIF